ncbi:hypothetical protein [Fodinibius sp. Rm-B-1B1-1]|uniref:hypothetical protein n=1 Tax=Fodinibius alkaliphilus TaxID=3140241 RepID=UPI00315A9704
MLGKDKFFQYNQRKSWIVLIGTEEKEMFYSQEFYLAPDYEKTKEFDEVPWHAIAEPHFLSISINGYKQIEITLQHLIEACEKSEDGDYKKDYLNTRMVLSKAF